MGGKDKKLKLRSFSALSISACPTEAASQDHAGNGVFMSQNKKSLPFGCLIVSRLSPAQSRSCGRTATDSVSRELSNSENLCTSRKTPLRPSASSRLDSQLVLASSAAASTSTPRMTEKGGDLQPHLARKRTGWQLPFENHRELRIPPRKLTQFL